MPKLGRPRLLPIRCSFIVTLGDVLASRIEE
jgi:hypothetical protein